MKTPSSLNLLNGILESSKEVIFILDCNYCYLAFNEKHRETMKNIWDVDIQVGDNMLDYIKYQEDRNKSKSNFDRALSGESFTIVEEYGDTSINRRWYQNEYNPLYDDSGNVIGLTVFLSDVTEQKQAEEKSNKIASEYETIFEASKALMFLAEVVDEKTFVYIKSNKAGQELTGFSSEEIVGKTPEKNLGEDQGRQVSLKYRQCLQAKTSLSYEETLLLPTGHRTFYTSLTPIFDKKGEVTHILDSSIDLTERKQAEEELKKSEAYGGLC